VFDIAFLNARGPAGVGTGPSSLNDGSTSIFIAARGVDNNSDPRENDGKIYELSLGDEPPADTPTPPDKPTKTPKPTSTPESDPPASTPIPPTGRDPTIVLLPFIGKR
jgi:hypothetical protein